MSVRHAWDSVSAQEDQQAGHVHSLKFLKFEFRKYGMCQSYVFSKRTNKFHALEVGILVLGVLESSRQLAREVVELVQVAT